MSAPSAFDSIRSTELASSIRSEAGSVVVVVTIALERLLSSGAAAS
jgi:hypothetical protein